MKKKILLLGSVLLLAISVLLFWPRSSNKISDSDLQIVRTNVPPQENAFFILLQATNDVDLSEDKMARVRDLYKSKSWDSNRVFDLLNEYQKAIQVFERASQYSRLQIPEIRTFEEEWSYLGDWKQLTEIVALRAKLLFRSGQEKDAFDLTVGLVQFGHRIEDSGGALLHYMAGAAVKYIGFYLLREMAATTTLPCDNLREYIVQISTCSASGTGLTNAIKTEFRLQVDAYERMAAGVYPGSTNSSLKRTALSLLYRPVFNEQKTKEICASVAREHLKSIPLPWNLMATNLLPAVRANRMQLLLGGNAIGEVLTQMSLPAQERFLARKCRENNELAATQIILALRCYQMKNGGLPSSLTNLVPVFLTHIPTDDFDGKPFRYLPEKKIIYSVGEDFIDSGGQKENKKNERLDHPFPIEF